MKLLIPKTLQQEDHAHGDKEGRGPWRSKTQFMEWGRVMVLEKHSLYHIQSTHSGKLTDLLHSQLITYIKTL